MLKQELANTETKKVKMYYTEIGAIILALAIIFEWKISRTIYFKGFVYLFAVDSFFTILFYLFNIKFFSFTSIIINTFLFYCLFCKIISNIKSDKINKNHVCIIFYQNLTKFKQYVVSSPGINVASAGLLIGNKIYRIVKDKKYLFKENYTKNYIYSNYLVIDTGFSISSLKGDWESEILKQKARQPGTFWLRLNCLRSLKPVLNQIDNFKYQGEVLPSIYLLKLKIKGII